MPTITAKPIATINTGILSTEFLTQNNFIPVLISDPDSTAREIFKQNIDSSRVITETDDISNIRYEEHQERARIAKQKFDSLPYFSQADVEYLRISLDPLYLAQIIPDVKSKRELIDKMKSKKSIPFTREESEIVYKCLDFIEEAKPLHFIIENHKYLARAVDFLNRRFIDVIIAKLKQLNYHVLIDDKYNPDGNKDTRFVVNTFDQIKYSKSLIFASTSTHHQIWRYEL